MGNKLSTDAEEKKREEKDKKKKKKKSKYYASVKKDENKKKKILHSRKLQNTSSNDSLSMVAQLNIGNRKPPKSLSLITPRSSSSCLTLTNSDKETFSTLTEYKDARSHLNSPDFQTLSSPDLLEEIEIAMASEITELGIAVRVLSRF